MTYNCTSWDSRCRVKPTIDDVKRWWLCDRCKVKHYGMGGLLFGCERTSKTVKPTTSGCVSPKRLCKYYEPKEDA